MFESASPPPSFKARFRGLPSFSFRGSGLVKPLLRIAVLLAPFFFLRACFFTYVPPNEIGLRQVSFGPAKGLQKSLVLPGYRRQIRGFESVRTFPRSIQIVEFTNSSTEGSADHRTVPAINVPTVDGYLLAIT